MICSLIVPYLILITVFTYFSHPRLLHYTNIVHWKCNYIQIEEKEKAVCAKERASAKAILTCYKI